VNYKILSVQKAGMTRNSKSYFNVWQAGSETDAMGPRDDEGRKHGKGLAANTATGSIAFGLFNKGEMDGQLSYYFGEEQRFRFEGGFDMGVVDGYGKLIERAPDRQGFYLVAEGHIVQDKIVSGTKSIFKVSDSSDPKKMVEKRISPGTLATSFKKDVKSIKGDLIGQIPSGNRFVRLYQWLVKEVINAPPVDDDLFF
jgi:hypothetical protein